MLPSMLKAEALSTEDAPPIRQQMLLLEGRHEIIPSLGFSLNDPYMNQMIVGFAYNFHFLNWLSAGADFYYSAHFTTNLKDNVEKERYKNEKSFYIDSTYLKLLTGINLQAIPVNGKLAFFGKYVLHYDIHLTGGGALAMVDSQGGSEKKTGFAPFFGGGLRLFFMKWLCGSIEARDYLIQRVIVKSENSQKIFGHNYMLTFGVSIFLPAEVNKTL
jgi:outer membrane beta-barrel protein